MIKIFNIILLSLLQPLYILQRWIYILRRRIEYTLLEILSAVDALRTLFRSYWNYGTSTSLNEYLLLLPLLLTSNFSHNEFMRQLKLMSWYSSFFRRLRFQRQVYSMWSMFRGDRDWISTAPHFRTYMYKSV